MKKLLNLLSANAKRGSFRAESGAGGNVIEVYDVIVSSDAEASWYGGVSLQAFSKALDGMSGDVILRINSPGGDVFAGIAMAQRMREYKGGVITSHVDGYAASAASLIAIAAQKCIMAPASMMMIHKAWTFAMGNSDDLLETADLLDKIDGQLAETYAQRGGKKTAADFMAMLGKDTWLSPQETLDLGLCDELVVAGERDAAQARALWDMSVFDNAPKPPAKAEQSESEKAAAAKAAAKVTADAEAAAAESERQQRVRALQALLVTAA